MNRRTVILIASASMLLAACASAGTTDPAAAAAPIDVSKSDLAVATHNDFQAAAKYATDHGYPERAAVWQAHDAHLTAVEGQISACANAIAGDLAAMKPQGVGSLTPFLAVEMAAEAVGNFSGASAKTKILCAPFPLVRLPILPKLP